MNNLFASEKLPREFYLRDNVVDVARDLLGKFLCTNIDGILTVGKVVETEAYNGRTDKACHAYQKRTNRTEIMYEEGGSAYVYLCYGIHHLFNIVTNRKGLADAVLIRALEPILGVEIMKLRRNQSNLIQLTSGPGKLSQSMGIMRELNGADLAGNQIWISEGPDILDGEVEVTTRVGVDYAEEDAFLPWRFYLKGNDFVSVISNKKTPD